MVSGDLFKVYFDEDVDLELKLNNVDNEDVVKKINSREEWKEMIEELDGFLDDS